jgi:hypothetical protein
MKNEDIFEIDWPYIVSCLPELEISARELGALRRRRSVDSAEMLLRLALVHAFFDHSLRETALWAETADVASVSDVALLKRFRQCGPWLGHLVLQKIAERSQWSSPIDGDLRVRIVDATHLSSPGAKGTDWRLHLGLDLGSLMVDHVEFTDWRVGESFDRFPVVRNELLVGDRGYAHRDPMARVAEAGGSFLVRIPWNIVPLTTADGSPFDLFPFLRSIPEADAREAEVSFTSSDDSVVSCRLIALRKSAACAEASRKKVLSEKSRKCRSIDPRTLEAAEYTILLTNVEAGKLSCHQALEIYRLRWQIENTFKRFKSLLNLDHLAAREPRMVQTCVLAKILGALLVEDLTDRYLSFFPWGYPLRATPDLSMATLQTGP